jgi:hypothetical protein
MLTHAFSDAIFFRTSKAACFFNLITLNRSKSDKLLRLTCCSLFFAQLDSAHF